MSSALSSSAECRALALRVASGGEDFKAAEEGLRASVLSGTCGALSALLSEADGEREAAPCGDRSATTRLLSVGSTGRAGSRSRPSGRRLLRRVGGAPGGGGVGGREAAGAERALGEALAGVGGGVDAAEAPAATAYCCLDGTGVPVLPGERRGSGRGGEGEPAKTREAKVATFHTAEGRDARTGLPRRDIESAVREAVGSWRTSSEVDLEPLSID